jgi:hypothetical protein
MATGKSPRHRRATAGIAALGGAIVVSGVPADAVAQQSGAVVSGARQANPTDGVRTPSDMLDKLDWDPSERGPLLIVSPELAARGGTVLNFGGSRPNEFRPTRPDELKEPGPAGYRLTAVDEVFGRKVTTVGSLTAAVPRTMSVLEQKFPPPDPYADLSEDERQRVFLARLTPDQWRRLASPEGVGANDFPGEMRSLFLSLLPEKMAVRRQKPDGTTDYDGEEITLTDAQRAAVRLSARRSLAWSFDMVETPGGRMMMGNPRPPSPDGLVVSGIYRSPDRSQAEGTGTFLGATLRTEVPNRQKPSDIDYDALNGRAVDISFAATVGELVTRAARATGLELYADPRYRNLNVHARGGPVRAGDLLRALALSVTGTFRRVVDGASGGAYVLTDDLTGLAVRHARIAAYGRAVAAAIGEREREINRQFLKARPADYLGFAPDDPFRPSDALGQKIDGYLAERAAGGGTRSRTKPDRGDLFVPVENLPQAAREQVQKQLAAAQKQASEPPPFPDFPRSTPRADAVRLDVRLALFYVLPGMGAAPVEQHVFSSNEWRSLGEGMGVGRSGAYSPSEGGPTFLEDLTLPVALPAAGASKDARRVLFVTAAGPEEAASAASAARRYGLDTLCLRVSAGATAEEVGALVRAARAAAPGVRLWVSVAVLRAGQDAPTAPSASAVPPERLDRNVLGETFPEYARRRAAEPSYVNRFGRPSPGVPGPQAAADGAYLRPDLPAVRAAVRERLAAISRLPGLTGVVLRDLTPPGYGGKDARQDVLFTGGGDDEQGYSDAARLTFLRRWGADPIDLSPYGDDRVLPDIETKSFSMFDLGRILRLPLFPDYGPNAASMQINSRRANELGARDAFAHWDDSRMSSLLPLLADLSDAIGGAGGTAPTLAIWDADPASGPRPAAVWRDRRRPTPTEPGRNTGSAAGRAFFLPLVRATRPWEPPLPPDADRAVRKRLFAGILSEVNRSAYGGAPSPAADPSRAGFVIDLSDRPLEEALDLLTVLRPVGG